MSWTGSAEQAGGEPTETFAVADRAVVARPPRARLAVGLGVAVVLLAAFVFVVVLLG